MIYFIRNNIKILGTLFVIFIILSMSTCGKAEVIIEGKLIREKSVQPGETYQVYIQIKNNGTRPAQIKIYQTDYLFSYQGWCRYPEPAGQIERSNGNWINFTPSLLVIPPRENSTINCTIHVPSDYSLKGTYWSMLMIEEMIPDDEINHSNTPDPQTTDSTLNIQQIMRYGIQLISNIGDSGTRDLKILDQKLILSPPSENNKDNNEENLIEKREEEYVLQLDIENTGERLLRPLAWVELYDQQGSFIGRYEGGKFIIFPENSVRYKINLKNLLSQEYKALVILDNGDENIWGSQFTLSI